MYILIQNFTYKKMYILIQIFYGYVHKCLKGKLHIKPTAPEILRGFFILCSCSRVSLCVFVLL